MTARILAIDPGPVVSAVVLFDGDKAVMSDIAPNEEIAGVVRRYAVMEDTLIHRSERPTHFAVEVIRSSNGHVAGAELFDAQLAAGRFLGEWLAAPRDISTAILLPRTTIRVHLVGPKAGDPEVRSAIIARMGDKATGISSHKWAALAVAITAYDRLKCGVGGIEPWKAKA